MSESVRRVMSAKECWPMGNNRPDPDARLLQQLKTGGLDEATWRKFVGHIRNWISQHYPSLRHHADDLAEEAAVCAFEGLSSFRGHARFIRWVHRIAHHVVSKYLRKQGDVVIMSFEEMREEVVAADEINRRMLQLAADAAMQTLTDQERSVFLLRVNDDVDHKEIARRLGISHNASRQTWLRASRKIGRYRRENLW